MLTQKQGGFLRRLPGAVDYKKAARRFGRAALGKTAVRLLQLALRLFGKIEMFFDHLGIFIGEFL